MSDERLDILQQAVAESSSDYGPVRIDRLKISNYRFFRKELEILCGGSNLLVYGENGSGKSTIYKALEYLTRRRFDSIATEKNIFAEEGEPLIEFAFTNGTELLIHSDLTELPAGFDFIKGLSIFTPMLDYKKLLKVHYSPATADKINIYDMLRELFSSYEVETGVVLAEIVDPPVYFSELQKIINGVLLEDAQKYLGYFDNDFKINGFSFKQAFSPDRRLEPVIHIEVDYRENQLDSYHTFLNEARLSALAVSIYFAAIKALHGTLKGTSLKILALDDLLISLDMSNRLKLLKILQAEFTDFQIFFFTHDKEMFELYKDKMKWEKYELYLDDAAEIPDVIVKKGTSELERAKEFYAAKEYDCCALLLRKGFEKVLKAYLPPKEQRDKNCKELMLDGLVGRAKSLTSGEAKLILEKLESDRTHILNPLSHNDDRPIYSEELRSAMEDLGKLKGLLR